jgi:hypothetical protein
MECHDVQQLLAFVNRPSEELDVNERDLLSDHLANCPDCAARLQAERRADEMFGPILRNVTVPEDLKQKILHRLSADRPRPWKTWLAAAAIILVTVSGAVAWLAKPKPEVTIESLMAVLATEQMQDDALDDYFKSLGLSVKVPRQMNYQFLNSVDSVDFENRKVVKLSFSRMDERHNAVADVMVLSEDHFRIGKLPQEEFHGRTTSLRIWRETNNPGFVYVAYFRGASLNPLLRVLN